MAFKHNKQNINFVGQVIQVNTFGTIFPKYCRWSMTMWSCMTFSYEKEIVGLGTKLQKLSRYRQNFDWDLETLEERNTQKLNSMVKRNLCNEQHNHLGSSWAIHTYINIGYLGSYHDVDIFWHLNIHRNWC